MLMEQDPLQGANEIGNVVCSRCVYGAQEIKLCHLNGWECRKT
jgi:hypothetical protein